MKRLAIVCVVVGSLLFVTGASATVFLHSDFESGPQGWNRFGQINGEWGPSLWHLETDRWPSNTMAYNTGAPDYDYDVGVSWGVLASPWMDLSGASEVYMEFDSWLETEDFPYHYDLSFVILRGQGTPWIPIPIDFQVFPQSEWLHFGIDLSALAGVPVGVKVGFFFDSIDEAFNDYEGWYVDNVFVHDGQEPPIPEPSTWLLLSTGLLGVGAAVRRRFRG